MSWFENIFSWEAKNTDGVTLPALFPMPIVQSDFIAVDVVTIFTKILTDVLERTHGLSEEQTLLMWDNCVKSSSEMGLISRLASAMVAKSELYLVVDSGVIREAKTEEKKIIQADYEKKAESETGIFISFKSFRRVDMIRLYSALEYATISALNKSLNISAAPQFKFSDLRASVALIDAPKVQSQAMTMADGLLSGRAIMMDAKDSVETATPDLSATEKSIDFIAAKLAFYLGLPSSYITGEQTGGIGASGENDARAIERGLKNYFFSIVKPVLESLFGTKVSYKSQDFRNLDQALETLKTFALTDEEFISAENKTLIVNRVFDLPEDSEGDPAPKPVPAIPPTADPAANARPSFGGSA